MGAPSPQRRIARPVYPQHHVEPSRRDDRASGSMRRSVSRPASDRPSIEKLLAKETERLGRRLKNKLLFGDKRNPNPTAWLRRGETRTCVTSATAAPRLSAELQQRFAIGTTDQRCGGRIAGSKSQQNARSDD
jgi:hypothetical protein